MSVDVRAEQDQFRKGEGMPQDHATSGAPSSAVAASRAKSASLVGGLKIPGSSLIFKGLTEIFNALKPDPIAIINAKLDLANARLANTYNVVLATLEIWDLHKTIDGSSVHLGELMHGLEKDQRSAATGYPIRYDEVRRSMQALYGSAMAALSEGARLLSGYESATQHDQGNFLQYIGQFDAIVNLPYQCVALAQRGFNVVIDHNEHLTNAGQALNSEDRELEDDANAAAISMGKAWQDYLIALPSKYPKWCAPIFASERFSLVTAYPKGKGVRGLPATMTACRTAKTGTMMWALPGDGFYGPNSNFSLDYLDECPDGDAFRWKLLVNAPVRDVERDATAVRIYTSKGKEYVDGRTVYSGVLAPVPGSRWISTFALDYIGQTLLLHAHCGADVVPTNTHDSCYLSYLTSQDSSDIALYGKHPSDWHTEWFVRPPVS